MPPLPTIRGMVAYPVEQAIHQLSAEIDALAALARQVEQRQPPPLTLEQIRAALGATGSAPLNIFTLLGGDASGFVQVGTHADRIGLNIAGQATGTLFWETDRTALYVIDAQQWWLIENQPLRGTIDPAVLDEKPTDLGTQDSGFVFYATDFDRLFRWTGSAWEDAPGQDVRGSFLISDATADADFVPGNGWAFCDGSSVTRSTPDGGVTAYTVPDLLTANRFFRAATTSGVTGGAATHTHDVDLGSAEVQAGTGASVAGNTGTVATSGPDEGLPPYYTFRPYVRL